VEPEALDDIYDTSKIKEMVLAPRSPDPPPYTLSGIHRRSIETDEEALEDKAINVADRAMNNEDIKVAMDGAKSVMNWMGKGKKANTTIFAKNAQINQLENDPKSKEHILQGLKDIAKITNGTRTQGEN